MTAVAFIVSGDKDTEQGTWFACNWGRGAHTHLAAPCWTRISPRVPELCAARGRVPAGIDVMLGFEAC